MARLITRVIAASAAATVAVTLALAPTPAMADWHGGYGGWRGGYGGYGGWRGGYGGYGPGAVVGGALLGLGVGALLASPYVAPPPVVYAPPPVYYAPPPVYYPPPGYPYYR